MTVTGLPVANSYAALDPGNPVRRPVRSPGRSRSQAFSDNFDARTLFYDCFWHADGRRVLLVGPPIEPFHRRARFIADPGGVALSARQFSSLSTTVTELRGAPASASVIRAEIGGEVHLLPIRPSSVRALAGRRLLFSINRDNDLAWIREWASFHAKVHGTDAVILFDNGSTKYAADEVLDVLREVPGIAVAGVPSWPYSFGPVDQAVKRDPYWARFLQIGSMSVLLRRYGEQAYGLLDCDIDELAGTRSGQSIYQLAKQSRDGLIAFHGQWIEATGPGTRHRDFCQRLSDPSKARCRPRKWALDPSRPWVGKLSVHPYWHWIEGRPPFSKTMPEDALYWHFRGINTDWKSARNRPPAEGAALETDRLLQRAFAGLDG